MGVELFRANTGTHTNPAFTSTLAGSVPIGATSFAVPTGMGALLPSPTGGDWFRLRIGTDAAPEVARVTGRNGDTLTCDALEAAHTSGDAVVWTVSGETLEGLQTVTGDVTVEYDYIEISSNVTITSTTQNSPDNIVSGNAITYDGNVRVKIELYIPTNDPNGTILVCDLWDGSTNLGEALWTGGGGVSPGFIKLESILTPSAGSHTYHVKGWLTGSSTVLLASGNTRTNGYFRITNANPTVSLPYATTTSPGVVKVGTGLSIDSAGTLSASATGGGFTEIAHATNASGLTFTNSNYSTTEATELALTITSNGTSDVFYLLSNIYVEYTTGGTVGQGYSVDSGSVIRYYYQSGSSNFGYTFTGTQRITGLAAGSHTIKCHFYQDTARGKLYNTTNNLVSIFKL